MTVGAGARAHLCLYAHILEIGLRAYRARARRHTVEQLRVSCRSVSAPGAGGLAAERRSPRRVAVPEQRLSGDPLHFHPAEEYVLGRAGELERVATPERLVGFFPNGKTKEGV